MKAVVSFVATLSLVPMTATAFTVNPKETATFAYVTFSGSQPMSAERFTVSCTPKNVDIEQTFLGSQLNVSYYNSRPYAANCELDLEINVPPGPLPPGPGWHPAPFKNEQSVNPKYINYYWFKNQSTIVNVAIASSKGKSKGHAQR